MKDDLEHIIEYLKEELSGLRTNRATPILVENIKVDAYGSSMPLNQLATISAPEANQILIKPYDQNLIKNIEKSINESDLGFSPTNEGKQLRITIPPLTEERRNELVKIVGQKAEEARISIRKKRDEEMKIIKNNEKSGEISEDDKFKQEKTLQNEIDDTVNKVNNLASDKEGELKTI